MVYKLTSHSRERRFVRLLKIYGNQAGIFIRCECSFMLQYTTFLFPLNRFEAKSLFIQILNMHQVDILHFLSFMFTDRTEDSYAKTPPKPGHLANAAMDGKSNILKRNCFTSRY